MRPATLLAISLAFDRRQRAVIVAALIASKPARTSAASCKCPARSMESMRIGTRGRNRLPQTRSDVSHNMMSASRTASP
jgi:hypothetical protein